jgi:predicted amidohydrolase YtcJ
LCGQCEARAADVRVVDSIDDILRIGREQAARTPAGEWVFLQGASFQDGRIRDHRFPTGAELDSISTDHPILYITQLHRLVVNSVAMRMAGITRDTPDPPGSRIERDPDTGEPDGGLMDMYAQLPLPADDARLTEASMKRVGWDHFLSHGVTTILEIVDSPAIMEMQRQLVSSGEVPLRVRAVPWLPKAASIEEALEWAQASDGPWIDEWFEFDAIKLFSDGGTSTCTAAFHDEYLGHKGNRGSLVYTDDELRRLLRATHEQGLQALVHAAGDRAQDQVVAAFGDVADHDEIAAARHRIEHMGNVGWTPERARACQAVGVLPAPNLGFTYHFGEYWPTVLGNEVGGAETVPLRSMLRAGFPLFGTSDTTGADLVILHPLQNILTATLRQTYAGRVVNPDDGIPPSTGVELYTTGSAYGCRIEDTRGSLEVGKLGDLVVLDGWAGDDADEDALRQVSVAHTVVGGEVVWSAG